jgi:hypothetical protein
MLRGLVAPIGLCVLAGAVAACRGPGASEVDAADRADAAETLDAPGDAPGVDALQVDAAVDGPPGLPDLQFVASQMTQYLVTPTDIPVGDCAVDEGCVSGTGIRQLLRFKTVTVNRGAADLSVGRPPDPGMSDLVFEWSECHKHHHFKGYTRYELVNEGGVVLTGRKQSFCLSDNKQIDPGVPFPHYQCNEQGVSRGWADVYDIDVACQWIDVTNVAPGAYTLRIIVNPENNIHESDTTNNVFTLNVRI